MRHRFPAAVMLETELSQHHSFTSSLLIDGARTTEEAALIADTQVLPDRLDGFELKSGIFEPAMHALALLTLTLKWRAGQLASHLSQLCSQYSTANKVAFGSTLASVLVQHGAACTQYVAAH